MNDINENIAHITCNKCGKHWQVLNEDGTDWDEPATAEVYHSENHACSNDDR
jgi:hypothetical protein